MAVELSPVDALEWKCYLFSVDEQILNWDFFLFPFTARRNQPRQSETVDRTISYSLCLKCWYCLKPGFWLFEWPSYKDILLWMFGIMDYLLIGLNTIFLIKSIAIELRFVSLYFMLNCILGYTILCFLKMPFNNISL